MFIQAIKRQTKNLRHGRHSRSCKNLTTPNADQLFVKNKIMFGLLFQDDSRGIRSENSDAPDKPTINHINNSYIIGDASIDSQERVSNVL